MKCLLADWMSCSGTDLQTVRHKKQNTYFENSSGENMSLRHAVEHHVSLLLQNCQWVGAEKLGIELTCVD